MSAYDSESDQYKPTIVKKWDVKDRGDGVEIRAKYRDGRKERRNWSDEDVRELIEVLESMLESDDRPVTEGTHVR